MTTETTRLLTPDSLTPLQKQMAQKAGSYDFLRRELSKRLPQLKALRTKSDYHSEQWHLLNEVIGVIEAAQNL